VDFALKFLKRCCNIWSMICRMNIIPSIKPILIWFNLFITRYINLFILLWICLVIC